MCSCLKTDDYGTMLLAVNARFVGYLVAILGKLEGLPRVHGEEKENGREIPCPWREESYWQLSASFSVSSLMVLTIEAL